MEKQTLKGTPASLGRGQGRVVILEDGGLPESLPHGDLVLVGENIPTDIVSLDGNVCAVVTDEGGILCHGAILAREMGIPAVVGARDATTVLRNGELVLVDGDKGLVVIK